jgi:hypothetical protein
MRLFLRTGCVLSVFILFLPQVQARRTVVDSQFRELLTDGIFQSSGMKRIFADGSTSTPKLIEALNDSNKAVNLNAQLMLRLIGDHKGITDLHDWYEKPRPVLSIVNGPVPVPLRDWDYQQIGAVLARPPREWRENALNYLYALSIDQSRHAKELLTKMLSAAETDNNSAAFQVAANLRRWQAEADACSPATPQEFVRKHSFFLAPEERKNSKIKLIGYSNDKHLALLSVSQTFGNSFWVVLRNTSTCWRYQSAALYATNN